MKFNRFEEIEVWKLSRQLVKDIYCITETGPFSKDFGLKNRYVEVLYLYHQILPKDTKGSLTLNLLDFFILQKVLLVN